LRKPAYPNEPKTLGEHFLRRRLQAGKLQREVAHELTITTSTYLLWESDRSTPEDRYYPRIFSFLGYDPFPAPTNLPEKIRRKRLELGLPVKDAARLINVDEGTLARWERGEGKPRTSQAKVDRFMAMSVPHRLLVR
jgi:transcriptional regulator with XRE-family HTH domain